MISRRSSVNLDNGQRCPDTDNDNPPKGGGCPLSASAREARVRGVAFAELLARVDPRRRDLAARSYVALRRRGFSRTLAADLAARACAAFDRGADFATIAAEMRVPTNWLTPRAPAGEDGPDVGGAPPDVAARGMARGRGAADRWHARAVRAEPAPAARRRP